jgi:hypothetical protein
MNKILNFLLDCPKEYWIIIFGWHFKKAFWGILCLVIGSLILYLERDHGSIFLLFGGLLIIFGVLGNIYTKNKPYFRLWKKM